jgi:hypothetical protein
MFCPACGAEYVEGIDECEVCRVPLAAERTDASDDEDTATVPTSADLELVTVLETSDAGLIALVKSLLEGSGIPYWVQGEATQGLWCTPLFPSLFQVERRYECQVKELLEELRECTPAIESD